MINSVPALCKGLSASLRDDVLPHLDDAFARGQLFAAIYVLNNLERQAGWSAELLASQAEAALQAIETVTAGAQAVGVRAPAMSAPVPVRTEATHAGDEARRDAADAHICTLFDWFADLRRDGSCTPALLALEAGLVEHSVRAVKQQKRLVAPSMMQEMTTDAR